MMREVLCALCALFVAVCAYAAGEGRPLKEGSFDAVELFKNPPPGYGEVPFYWWMGDKLDKKRILSHLEELKGKGIQSLQVNYAHSDKGGHAWGLTYPSQPPVMTPKWWELFEWFKNEANARGMTVSLSDYTLGVGQGQFVDRAVKEKPSLKASVLYETRTKFDGAFRRAFFTKKPICAAVYALGDDDTVLPATRENVTSQIDKSGVLELKRNGRHVLICVYSRPVVASFDPTNPDSGKLYIKHFFGEFEKRLGGTKGLNFFFSDELDFRVRGKLWSAYLREEFAKAKGYDIADYLDFLFVDDLEISPKIKLDFNDVFVSLSEQNFFKPVYDWHESRGLIYGCDHGGRGLIVDEFGDYFKTQRWNQGPGCDQPMGASNLIKNKVAASISHMYGRPRVWLEGFYGSGWGQTPAHLTNAIFSNFAMGHNLLSLHGLYYATMGGWWEWAPPCNHFRQPYWKEMPHLLKCVERLSFLLSQGVHCADVAIMYPVESKVAGFGEQSVKTAFDLAKAVYANGTDFDFVDADSIERAEFSGGKIRIAKESFEVLFIPAMEAMRHKTLEKLLELSDAGARIWFVGPTPFVSDWVDGFAKDADKEGASLDNPKISAEEISRRILENGRQSHKFSSVSDAVSALGDAFEPDFKILSEAKVPRAPRVLHRKINGDDYYVVYNLPKGTECAFRSTGAVTLLDPFTGEESRVRIVRQNDTLTRLHTPLNSTDLQILRFNAGGRPLVEVLGDSRSEDVFVSSKILDGKWKFSVKPVLDNRWGDFAWPARREIVGPQIRFLNLGDDAVPAPGEEGVAANSDQIGFSTKFLQLGPLPEPLPGDDIPRLTKKYSDNLKPLKISIRYGLLGDTAHQGYHGLKAEITDNFIRLGAQKKTATSIVRAAEPEGKHYYLYTRVYAPRDGVFKILSGEKRPAEIFVNGAPLDASASDAELRAGANEVVLHYDSHGSTYLVFCDPDAPEGHFMFAGNEKPLSMSWNGMKNILPFDATTDFTRPLRLSFESAPALEELRFVAFGSGVKLYVNGNPVRLSQVGVREDGACAYRAKIPKVSKSTSAVTIEISSPKEGIGGGAAVPYYINQSCGTAEIEPVSWDKMGGMLTYSGGALYSKKFDLPGGVFGKKVLLDLGKVGGLARVRVNGKDAGVRFAPPWTFDITKQTRISGNLLEIEVYNTAANHYVTIPTRYRGKTESGLLAQPRLNFYVPARK